MSHPPPRRRLARAFLLLAILVTVPYLASAHWWFGWLRADGLLAVEVMAGCLCLADSDPNHDSFALSQSPGFNAGLSGNQLTFARRHEWVSGQRLSVIPLWPIPLAAAAITAALFLTSRRFAPGCCTRCGYDLRGLPCPPTFDLITCPECGRTARFALPPAAP